MVFAALLLSSCTTSYPYLVLNDNCNCERFVYRDASGKFDLELAAKYVVDDRVRSTLEFTFRNKSREPLSLRQGHIKGTSVNVRYEFNGRLQPLPFVVVPAGQVYTFTMEGADTELTENPWLKIAGEKVVVEIRGLLLGSGLIPPIVLTLQPLNPKLGA